MSISRSSNEVAFWFLATVCFALLAGGSGYYWDEYYYLYGLSRHRTDGLLELEPGMVNLFFPPSFFSAKVGFLLLVEGLMDLFGSSPEGIEGIRWFFLLLALPFAGVHYLLFREAVGERPARWAGVAVLFIPVTLYLGGKILTEIPSSRPLLFSHSLHCGIRDSLWRGWLRGGWPWRRGWLEEEAAFSLGDYSTYRFQPSEHGKEDQQ